VDARHKAGHDGRSLAQHVAGSDMRRFLAAR
jgi:hypothetical protein